MLSRNQMVLDMSRSDVREYLYESICAVLDSANIEYIKWDFNRSVANVYSNAESPSGQGEIAHRFVLGLYELLERLLDRYPELMIEGCAGGGGRFDAGMMYYCPHRQTEDPERHLIRLSCQYHGEPCIRVSQSSDRPQYLAEDTQHCGHVRHLRV